MKVFWRFKVCPHTFFFFLMSLNGRKVSSFRRKGKKSDGVTLLLDKRKDGKKNEQQNKDTELDYTLGCKAL